MQKKLLATVVASLIAGQAMALEVFNDDVNSLSIGGRVGMVTDGNDNGLSNDGSRINFKFAHQFQSGWTGTGTVEWGYDPQSTGDIEFSNRLGNVGIGHDEYGSFLFGKQWSAFYDVAGWTDIFTIGGVDYVGTQAIYDNGHFLGTARADDALSYRKSFGGLNVALQVQLEGTGSMPNGLDSEGKAASADITREKGYGISASYDFDFGLSLGAAYNETQLGEKYAITNGSDKSKAGIVSAKYTAGDFMIAASYGENTNSVMFDAANKDDKDNYVQYVAAKSESIEVVGTYALDSVVPGLALEAGYTEITDVTDYSVGKNPENKGYLAGVVYTVGPMEFAVQYKDATTTNRAGIETDADTLAGSVRYYF